MNIYIVEGGYGRHIFFTALIEKLAKNTKEKQIMIMSNYPEVFRFNPYVYKSFSRTDVGIWNSIVLHKNNNVCFADPYFHPKFIKREIHVLEGWSELFGIKYDKKMKPKIYTNDANKQSAKKFKKQFGKYLIFQFTCGQSPGNRQKTPFIDKGYKRAYPYQYHEELISIIKKEYPDLTLLNFSYPNEGPEIPGSFRIETDTINYYDLFNEAETYIGINSCSLHFSGCLNKKGIILWGASSPNQWGYENNINLVKECPKSDPACTRPYMRSLGDYTDKDKPWICDETFCSFVEPKVVIKNLKKILG